MRLQAVQSYVRQQALTSHGFIIEAGRSHCDSNLNKKDANGTSISDYMKIFKDYDIEGIPYKRKPQL